MAVEMEEQEKLIWKNEALGKSMKASVYQDFCYKMGKIIISVVLNTYIY